MIKEVLLLFVVSAFLTSCGAQRNLPPSEHAALPKTLRVKNVLIIGAGSAASSVFMDNLSKSFRALLTTKGVATDYIFAGNRKPGSRFDNRALDRLNYDAYLILYPLNSANIVMNRAYPLAKVPNSYQQRFSVQTYLRTDKEKPVWEGRLQVDLDPTDKEKYKEICYYLFNYLPLDYPSFP